MRAVGQHECQSDEVCTVRVGDRRCRREGRDWPALPKTTEPRSMKRSSGSVSEDTERLEGRPPGLATMIEEPRYAKRIGAPSGEEIVMLPPANDLSMPAITRRRCWPLGVAKVTGDRGRDGRRFLPLSSPPHVLAAAPQSDAGAARCGCFGVSQGYLARSRPASGPGRRAVSEVARKSGSVAMRGQ